MIRYITLGLALACTTAFAQPGPNRPPHGQGHPQAHAPGGPGFQRAAPGPRRGPHGPGPQMSRPGPHGGPPVAAYPEYRRFNRGDRLPPMYRQPQYVVNDWRAHRLQPPPRGYHWVQNGSDYVLVAIATGVISAVVLNALTR